MLEFIMAHKAELLGAALAISELVALSPLKSNSIVQLIVNILKAAAGKKEEPKL